MTNSLETYNKFKRFPGGSYLFNKAVGIAAPFFSTIKPNIVELSEEKCVVRMKDRRAIRNHMGTVNAGAMCTIAELTAGMALDATISKRLRWIPKKMAVLYLAKGQGTLDARCEFDRNIIHEGDIVLPVRLINTDNITVFTADVTFYISKKPRKLNRS